MAIFKQCRLGRHVFIPIAATHARRQSDCAEARALVLANKMVDKLEWCCNCGALKVDGICYFPGPNYEHP